MGNWRKLVAKCPKAVLALKHLAIVLVETFRVALFSQIAWDLSKIDSSLLANDEESFENELVSLPRQFTWSTDSKDSLNSALEDVRAQNRRPTYRFFFKTLTAGRK